MSNHETNRLLCVFDTTKTNRSGPIFARRHEQEFAVLVEAIGLREIPQRSLRLVIAAAAQDAAARVFVNKFVSPLPYVAH